MHCIALTRCLEFPGLLGYENVKKPGANQGHSASELISKRIAELGGWRGKMLAIKALVRRAAALNSSGKSKSSRKAKS